MRRDIRGGVPALRCNERGREQVLRRRCTGRWTCASISSWQKHSRRA